METEYVVFAGDFVIFLTCLPYFLYADSLTTLKERTMPHKKTPHKYLRRAALSAVFAMAALPAAVQAQSYDPDADAVDREMRSAASAFQYSYRNPSEWDLRRLESCNHSTAEPRINSKITVRETVYDHSSLTSAELDSASTVTFPGLWQQTLGTTGGQYNYSVGVTGATYRKGGEDCVHLTAVDIDVTFTQTIRTASELLDHSCHLEEVLEHEELHAMFNKTAIENYGAVIENLVAKNAENVNRRVVPRGKTATDVLGDMQKLFSSTVGDTLEAAVDKAETKHKRIDTLSNYLETQKEAEAKCGYKLPKFPQPGS